MITGTYTIGRLYTRPFRRLLTTLQAEGTLTYEEIKYVLNCDFVVRAPRIIHLALAARLHRATAR